MLNLASFAIYKLFHGVGARGLCRTRDAPFGQCCPAGRRDAGTPVPAAPKEPKKPPVRTELPSGWETMHPATILCIMRPGLSYSDYGSSGDNTTGMQHLGITWTTRNSTPRQIQEDRPSQRGRESVQLSVRHKLRLRDTA
ncbi:uncharacterized protein LOC116803145 [Drosophila sechellia]|uniref:uncharacterized protein LOC116803145 n=1 Tax=Drosophila sechellia TaxID=7238 RepID=UPI0013DD8875|nr:uncharacterized protein LOC116803145 [Drosophila sechellia]